MVAARLWLQHLCPVSLPLSLGLAALYTCHLGCNVASALPALSRLLSEGGHPTLPLLLCQLELGMLQSGEGRRVPMSVAPPEHPPLG